MNLTALFVLAGGFICIVIVLMKHNYRSQFMKLYKYQDLEPSACSGLSSHLEIHPVGGGNSGSRKSQVWRVLSVERCFPRLESWAVTIA